MKLKIIIIVKRLYKEYIKKYINRLILAISYFQSFVAGSTSAIAWFTRSCGEKKSL